MTTRWIGVDLNTTGHVAVAADPSSGKVMKLGKNIHYVHTHSIKNCTKLFREGKLWKLNRIKTRERKQFKSALHAICRQIVMFAELMGTGIKFERLFSTRYSLPKTASDPFVFSFENGSFFTLQRLVERRAHEHGIEVCYVDPAFTSKRCCRCGYFGHRSKKEFLCPHCGYHAHADVNAAFNIATTPMKYAVTDSLTGGAADNGQLAAKQFRNGVRAQVPASLISPEISSRLAGENLLAVLE
jgi:putative transposase